MKSNERDKPILEYVQCMYNNVHTYKVPGCERDLQREIYRERESSRFVKIKNIKKQNLLYGCFKKQSTQKISNQKMKSKERDKSILEYVQCMYNNVHAFKVPGF